MSTIAVTNVKHPSAVDPAIVLDADGDVTYAGVHDFSAATVTGAPQGLVHVATQSFSAVSSVSLNGVFSATYDSYFLTIDFTTSAGATLNMRFRVSGSDDSSANYGYVVLRTSSLGSAFDLRSENRTQTSAVLTQSTGAGINFNAISTITKPFASSVTGGIVYLLNNVGNLERGGFGFNNSTSFDGFTIFPGSGTITGTLRVYGYQNS